MIRFVRRLLTAPVRRVLRWLRARAARRRARRDRRPEPPWSPAVLRLEPYEGRTQVGGQAAGVVAALAGAAVLVEPLVAMARAVGEEAMQPPAPDPPRDGSVPGQGAVGPATD